MKINILMRKHVMCFHVLVVFLAGTLMIGELYALAPRSAVNPYKKLAYEALDDYLRRDDTRKSVFDYGDFPPLPSAIPEGFLEIMDDIEYDGNAAKAVVRVDGVFGEIYFFKDAENIGIAPEYGISDDARLGSVRERGYSHRKGVLQRPLDYIPKEDIKSILVAYPYISSVGTPKLGEEVIVLWPLVTSLYKKYPKAIIYVMTNFPDLFRVKQFDGMIRPVPLSAEDAGNWGYNVSEWEGFTYDDLLSNKAPGTRLRFLSEKKVDMVIDPSRTNMMISLLQKEVPEAGLSVHMIGMESILMNIFAMSPVVRRISGDTFYNDPGGNVYKVPGADKMYDRLAPTRELRSSGIWNLSIDSCRLLGLDVDADNLTSISLDVSESVGALALVKKMFYEQYPRGVFDSSKKIIVINVYAVTQRTLMSRQQWIRFITEFIDNTENAYFIFTRGGKMDPDYDYVDDIAAGVNGKLRTTEMKIILPRIDIYPHLNNILGISSGLLTLDTGMSHVSNGVYNIPTAVVTNNQILHWLTPRENTFPIRLLVEFGHSPFQDGLFRIPYGEGAKAKVFEGAANSVREYARAISALPERPEAKAAKVAAASHKERVRMDRELVEKKLHYPGAKRDLIVYLRYYINALGIKEACSRLGIDTDKLIPTIVFVDSSAQTGVNVPRFTAKLYSPSRDRSYLLVDTGSLEEAVIGEGTSVKVVRDEVRGFDIIHEVLGHMMARMLFDKYMDAYERAEEMNEEELLEIKTEEEVVARLMLFFALLKMKDIEPAMVDNSIRKVLDDFDITASRDMLLDIFLLAVERLDKSECLSTHRYSEMLRRRPVSGEIKQIMIRDYLGVLADLFGVAGMIPGIKPSRREPVPAEVFGLSA
ncbi:hypothetical protein ACFLQ8_00790 [Candidatus Auribacterota bacterium]